MRFIKYKIVKACLLIQKTLTRNLSALTEQFEVDRKSLKIMYSQENLMPTLMNAYHNNGKLANLILD